jgi:hypothetical protein
MFFFLRSVTALWWCNSKRPILLGPTMAVWHAGSCSHHQRDQPLCSHRLAQDGKEKFSISISFVSKSTHGKNDKYMQHWSQKPKRKRYRCRWEDNIKMNLGERGQEVVDGFSKCVAEPLGSIKAEDSWTTEYLSAFQEGPVTYNQVSRGVCRCKEVKLCPLFLISYGLC